MIRIPKTENKSLQAWNAADELLVQHYNNNESEGGNVLIINDRFGYLAKQIKSSNIICCIDTKSQKEAIIINNTESIKQIVFNQKRELITEVQTVIINIPKSLELLESYLDLAYSHLTNEGTVYLGFMTKHFTKSYLDLCETYFRALSQSKAFKKARVLTLKSKVEVKPKYVEINEINLAHDSSKLVQYKGVFSKDHIDYGTSFLIDNLKIKPDEKTVLDLGSGNGVISYHINTHFSNKELHLLEDSYSAHLSGKLNIDGANIFHHWDYNLEAFSPLQFDLIITNPPFHFGHEIDLSIPMDLIDSCYNYLKPLGRLLIVSNSHINYTNLLNRQYLKVEIKYSNKKFNIWEAIK